MLGRRIVCSPKFPLALASDDYRTEAFRVTDCLKNNLTGLSSRLAGDDVLARWLADQGDLTATVSLHITLIQCVLLIHSYLSARTEYINKAANQPSFGCLYQPETCDVS